MNTMENNFTAASTVVSTDIRDFFSTASEFLNLLQPLLTALSWQGNFRNLFEALPEKKQSFGLLDLIMVLQRLNFKHMQLKKPLTKTNTTLTPFLLVPSNSAAVLVLQLTKDTATIINSISQQQETIPRTKLRGTAYIFTPLVSPANANHINNSGSWLKHNLRKFWPTLMHVGIISMFLSIFSLTLPVFAIAIYDKVLPAKSMPLLIFFSLGTSFVVFGSIFLHSSRTTLIANLSIKIEQLTTEIIFNKLLHLPPKYTETASVGSQLSRLQDFDIIKNFLHNPNIKAIFDLPGIVVPLCAIFILNTPLFLITISAILAFSGIYLSLNVFYHRLNQKHLLAKHYQQTFQTEALTNLNTIKAYASENIWCERYKNIFTTATTQGFYAKFYAAALIIIAEGLMLTTGVLMVWLGTLEVIQQHLTPGTLLAILLLSWHALTPIKIVFSLLPQLATVKTSILQIDKLLSLEAEPSKHSSSQPWPTTIHDGLEFNKVCFTYPEEALPALTNITLTVRANEVVCITGRNGSGKSTLLKLAHRMYTPQHGVIKLDNCNIQQLEPVLYRQTISYLAQTPQLFDLTIEQNLLLSNPTATNADIITATQLADVYTDIMQLPLQFKTPIISSEHNLLTSSSFKQRLGLARTFIRRTPLYLFDEPTNALNHEQFNAFMRAIDFLRSYATVLIVTHHPQLLKIADRVVYLEKSEIVDIQMPEILPVPSNDLVTEII